MKTGWTLLLATNLALGAIVAPTLADERPTVDVVHWLTAGAESAAVQILAKEYEARGGSWVDSAAPGGPGDAQAILMNRIAGGNPPDVSFLSMGRLAIELGEEDLGRDVKEIAVRNGLADISPAMVKLATDDKGRIFALPIAIETDNLAWYSKAAFEAAGLAYPKTWAEFIAQAPRFREKGIIPLAVGAQGWQINILFGSILMGDGGSGVFEAVVDRRDVGAVTPEQVVSAFTTLRALSTFSDAGASNRAWNDTLNLVADGRAAMQVMGSWAGAELIKMGLPEGDKWTCALAPGNSRLVMEGAGFQFPKVAKPAGVAGQDLFVAVLLDPKVQADFAAVKGAIPARLDADISKLSTCDRLAAATLREKGGFPALSTSISNESGGQIEDLMSRFWSDSALTPEAAAKEFVSLLAGGQ